jgi:excisionase family DNA binding protein
MEKSIIKRIMTSKEAIEYLGCSEYSFEQEVKRGNISFKAVGRIRLFPVWALDKWLNDTQIHIDCSNVVTSTTHTSRLSAKQENDYSLEKLLEQHQNKVLSIIASKGYQSYKRKLNNKPQVSFQA